MKAEHRKILNDLRETITDDVNVNNKIISVLESEGILNDVDIAAIDQGASDSVKAAILLDILLERDDDAFHKFRKALDFHYSWLNTAIENSLKLQQVNGTSRSPPPPVVPHGPALTVPREEKIAQLKRALGEVQPEGYVVLHGMKGYGKSSLAATVLKDKAFVKEHFNNKCYWIKFGYSDTTEDDILNQLSDLYYKITNREPPSNSSRLKEEICNTLKQYFKREPHRNSLLILDDVFSKSIIKSFNFHCKTLVITTDVTILDYDRHKIVIEMRDGFTLSESLDLFAKALEIKADKLFPEATKIHEQCNGMPILIAMFAAQFKEFKDDMMNNRARWKYYLQALREKDENNKVIETFLAKQETIFELCINELSPEELQRYESLVIFGENVNITPKTLEILWGAETFRVEEWILSLCHKSLAVRQWNDGLQMYIYGVHDLLLCHLRKRIPKNDIINQHARLFNNYKEYCKGNFANLPADNYSYSYIAHHLVEAQMTKKIKELYLDFNFIQSKLRNCSVTDLLTDLKKYRKIITDDDELLESQLSDLECLLKTQARVLADHRQRKCLDLVQIAMNHDPPGHYNQIARDIAKTQNYLYLLHKKQHPSFDDEISEEVLTEISCVRFTDDPDKILLGSKSGKILLWNCDKQKSIFEFTGHENTEIVKIIVSNNEEFFIALNNKSVIKRFVIKSDEELSDCEAEVHTPREKQSFWSDMHHLPVKDNSTTTYYINEGKITDVALSSDDQTIAACTNEGRIAIWKVNGETILPLTYKHLNNFQKLTFSKGSQYLHVVDTMGTMTVFNKSQNTYSYNSSFSILGSRDQIHNREQRFIHFQEMLVDDEGVNPVLLTVLDDRALITLSDRAPTGTLCNPSRRAIAEVTNSKYVTATVTHDGQYLITIDSDNLIKIWPTAGGFDPISSFVGGKMSVDTYFDIDSHLIISGEKYSIQRRCFQPESPPQSKRKPLFDAVMKKWGESDIVAQEVVGSKNKISIHCGYDLIAETRPINGKIMALALDSDGNQVVYSTDNNAIWLYNVYTKKPSTQIMTLTECSTFLKFIKIDNLLYVICKDQQDLKFWNEKSADLTIRAGNVMAIYCIRKKFIVTVARDEMITIWEITKTELRQIFKSTKMGRSGIRKDGGIEDRTRENVVCYCCLNSGKDALAILRTSNEVLFYAIKFNNDDEPEAIERLNPTYIPNKLTCCSFSPNDAFLAVGTDSGTILILDIINGKWQDKKLSLHSNAILQLHWAPSFIGAPILFSVNCDEMAWWNIELNSEEKGVKRSRTGLRRSSTTPTISPRSSITQSNSSSEVNSVLVQLPLKLAELQPRSNVTLSVEDQARLYWTSRKPKDPSGRPALLGLIPIPPSCKAKVCVSSDFIKFLLVDVHGSINSFQLLDYS